MGGFPTDNGFAAAVRRAALALAARGFSVVLNHAPTAGGGCTCGATYCPNRGKHPRLGKGWHKRATADASELGTQLDSTPVSNIGVLVTDGLVDVDYDHREAARAATVLMPPTGMVIGRESAPGSHGIYRSPGAKSETFTDPVMVRNGEARRANLVEVRVNGQTVMPPSVHKTLEVYRWEADADPATVTAADLGRAARETAAAALLGKYLQEGVRHKAALALAGWLCRNRWAEERILRFLGGVAAANNDDDPADREQAVRDTVAKLDAGGNAVTGLPKLVECLGPVADDVVAAVAKWLGLSTDSNSASSANSAGGWAAPVPLSCTPTVPLWPDGILPGWQGEWAAGIAAELQVPYDLPAALTVGLLSAGLARKVVVSPRPGFLEPVNLFVMAALPPGERKSQTFGKAIAPVQELQAELREQTKPLIAERESEARIAEKRLKYLEDKAAKAEPADREALKEELETARKDYAAVEVPAVPLFYTEDDTPEQLKHELVVQGGRMMVATTEAQCLENITAYSDRPNFDVYLKGHAGDEINTGRVTRGRQQIDRPALSCVLSPQPEVLRGLAEHAVLRGRGFLARWLYMLPASRVGFRTPAEPPVAEAVRRRYHALMRQAWATAYDADGVGNPTARILHFDPAAAAAFLAFEIELEPMLRSGGPLDRLTGWGNKLNGACARLAAVLHVADALGAGEPWDRPIGEGAVLRAVRLCREYLIPHAVAAFDLMGANPRVAVARRVWDWIVGRRLTEFTARDAFNGVRCATVETMDDLQPGLDLLEQHFLIRPKGRETGSRGRGRPGSPAYEVNPGGIDDPPHDNGRSPNDPPPPAGEPAPPAQKAHKSQKAAAAPPPGNSAVSANSAGGVSFEDAAPGPRAGDEFKWASEQGVGTGDEGTAMDGYTLVTDGAGLGAVVAAVEDGGVAGIDCETTGLDPRTDRVRLLQVGTDRSLYVIDLFSLPDPAADLAELFEVLARVTVVGHNLAFDLGFLAPLGFFPGPVFDTMVVAQVVSYGTDVRAGAWQKFKLADVVKRFLGRDVDKAEQKSDWSRADLTPTQLAYAAADAAVLLPLADQLREELAKTPALKLAVELEMRALPGIAWAAPVGVDADAWVALADASAAAARRLAEEMTTLVPNTTTLFDSGWNWNSPEQVKAAFAAVGVTLAGTDDDALAAVAHPLAGLLREYREAEKRAGTYGRKWLAKHARGGAVRPGWRQLGAVSGRMSCSDPNVQNIPRDPAYRRCFVAGPGRVLVKADYSQIELRIAAKVANETVMIAAYAAGRDLHALTAARVLGKPEAEVTKADRQLAKAVNFGLLYGMGANGLRQYAAAGYGVSLTAEQAKGYRDAFFTAYPGLRRWHERTRTALTQYGTGQNPFPTTTLGGRKALLPALKPGRAGGKPYPNLTEATNFPIQGTGADGFKAAVALFWERRAECPGAVPVIFCHDEIVLEVAEADVARAADWLKRVMVEAMEPMLRPVPVEVEVSVGQTWGG